MSTVSRGRRSVFTDDARSTRSAAATAPPRSKSFSKSQTAPRRIRKNGLALSSPRPIRISEGVESPSLYSRYTMMSLTPPRSPFSRKNVSISIPKTKLHHYDPQEVAQELCLMDSELLRKIKPQELEGGSWMKVKKDELAPNVLAMVKASNELAMLVPSEILAETTVQMRAKVICCFIKIACKCYGLHNFNSLKAILAGLQCTPVFRLKRSWREVPAKRKKKYEELTKLMCEEHNWSEYRMELQCTLDESCPCIPFLGVLLTTIVQQDSAHSVKRNGRRFSGVEGYTIMEAVTVRNRIEKIRRFSNNRFSVIPHEDLKPSVRRESRRLFSTSDDRSHLDNHAPLVAIGELSSLTEDRVSASTRDQSRILGNDEEEEEEEKTAPSEGESTNGFRSRCGGMFGDEQQTKRQDAHRKISLGQSGSDEGKSGSDEGEVHDKEVGVSGGLRPPDLCIDSSPGKNLDTPTNATSSFGATPTSGNPAESPSDDPIVAREGGLLSPEIKVVTPREDPKKVMQRCMSDQSVGLQPPPSIHLSFSMECLMEALDLPDVTARDILRSSSAQALYPRRFPTNISGVSMSSDEGLGLSDVGGSSTTTSPDLASPPSPVRPFTCPPRGRPFTGSPPREMPFINSLLKGGPFTNSPPKGGAPFGKLPTLPNSSDLPSVGNGPVLSLELSDPSTNSERNDPDVLIQNFSLSRSPLFALPSTRTEKKEEEEGREQAEDGAESPAEEPMRRRSRRRASKILHSSLATSDMTMCVPNLLERYQMSALGCCGNFTSSPILRDLIVSSSRNSEGHNYKLSYEREPQ